MPRPLRPSAAVLAVCAVLLTGCGEGGGEDLTEQRLDWEDCPAPSEAQGGGPSPSPLPGGRGEWSCATMKAPLDWDDSGGETIGLALSRVRASGPAGERIGSLIFNFGGPGGSGVTALPGFGESYATLRTRYDLVSFDPRGSAAAHPSSAWTTGGSTRTSSRTPPPTTTPSARSSSTAPRSSTRPARGTPDGCCPMCAPRTPPVTWT
ncbi:hypothetical protein GCM10023238_38640 [Streptomyces heliomycini]